MSEDVRVLWLVKGLGRGGAEQLLVNLAGRIRGADIGLDVAYLLPHKDAHVADLLEAGVGVHLLRGRTWPVQLRRLLREGGHQVLHTHSPAAAAVARLTTPAGTALVHTEHNMWGRYRPPTRWVNAVTAGRNKVIWAVSQGVADSIHPVLPGRFPPVQVLIHGVPEGEVPHGPAARRRARRSLGLSDDAVVIGTVGNLTPKKDHATMLKAMASVRARHPGVHLVIVGGGPLHEHLSTIVSDLGLDDAVLMLGRRDDVASLLPAFDVFTLSSQYEGLSIALLEAMQAGVPAVVTSVGGLPEVVRHGENGLLVPPGDPGELADTLTALAGDAAARTRLGLSARQRVSRFGIGPAAAELATTYLRLASPTSKEPVK